MLKESKLRAGGQHLGPVAGRVNTEVLLGLLWHDKASYLRAAPSWTPSLASTPAHFTVSDLLTVAGRLAP